MYTDVVHGRTEKRFKLAPSLEAVCLFCAIGLTLTAVVILLLPHEVLQWTLSHLE